MKLTKLQSWILLVVPVLIFTGIVNIALPDLGWAKLVITLPICFVWGLVCAALRVSVR
jgi:hypothetical protein